MILAIALAALGSPPAAPVSVRATYEGIRSAGCAGAALAVWTPVEARILRNTPFALAGHHFADPDLRAIFAQDGGWYRPSAAGPPPALSPDDAACVDRLAAREAELRRTWTLPSELEARMTRDHALFGVLRFWGGSVAPYGRVRFAPDPDGSWQLFAPVVGCEGAACSGYRIRCPAAGPCEATAAG